MEIFAFLLVVAIIAGYYLSQSENKNNKTGVPGKLVWMDKGRHTKPFFNNTYHVFGKPDLIYKYKGQFIAVEYKGRKKDIYDSDIIQAMSAALAARGDGYQISDIVIKTDSTKKRIQLPKPDRALHQLIESNVALVRRAKRGDRMPASPSYHKCRSCAYEHRCTDKTGKRQVDY